MCEGGASGKAPTASMVQGDRGRSLSVPHHVSVKYNKNVSIFSVSIRFPPLTFTFFYAYGELLIVLLCQGGDHGKAPAASTVHGDRGQSPTRSRSVWGDCGNLPATTSHQVSVSS